MCRQKEANALTTVGFVGLGLMGGHMAANLLKAGYKLNVYNRTAAKADTLVAAGAALLPLERLAAASDVIITCLSTPDVVRDALAAMLPAARPGTLFIDHSTIDPQTAVDLGEQAQAAGCAFLDAPVSGGPWGAEAGTLTIMAGGTPEAYERALPYLRVLGSKLYHCGPQGAGCIAKLCNNLLVGIHTIAAAEAMVLGVKAGIDAELLYEIISGATGHSAQLARNMELFTFPGQFDPGFSIDMLHKDLVLASGLARSLRFPLLLGAVTEQLFQDAQGRGLGDRDVSAAILPMEDQAGVRVRKQD